MSNRRRTISPLTVPQKPVVPSVDIKRLSFLKYRVDLTLHPDHNFRHHFHTYPAYQGGISGEFYGAKRAERIAKRTLAKYMRQISYRTQEVKRYIGKI